MTWGVSKKKLKILSQCEVFIFYMDCLEVEEGGPKREFE